MTDTNAVTETVKQRRKSRRRRQYPKGNKGWFGVGNKRAGNRKGIPNKFTKLIKDAVLDAGENAGEFLRRAKLCGSEGMTGYMEWMAINHPAVFGALVGRIYPSQIDVVVEDTRRTPYQSLLEAREALERRGLSAERVLPRLTFEPIEHDDADTGGREAKGS